MLQAHKNRMRRGGFTLIEVMIVVAIILALAGIVAITLFRQKDDATASLAKVDLRTINKAMELFRLDFDRWPTEEEGVAVLWNKEVLDPEADVAKWKEYLAEPLPKDRWGTDWGYRAESEHENREGKFDLWSNGPDKQEGTEDDIKNWTDEGEGTPTDSGTPSSTGGSSTTGG